MTALSPFSLLKTMDAGKLAGTFVDFVADRTKDATRPDGQLSQFSDVLSSLDANADGRFNGRDVVGHPLLAGTHLLDKIGTPLGFAVGSTGTAGTSNAAQAGTGPEQTADAAAPRITRWPIQTLLAGADDALATSFSRLSADMQGVNAIRAAYEALRAAR